MRSSSERLAIAVRGVVQGVGFRPFVYNAALACGLTGWVQNEAGMVRIEVQGEPAALEAFLDLLRRSPPPQARIDSLDIRRQPCQADGQAAFQIRSSPDQGTPRPTIPADLATCPECREEIRTPGRRRFGYPFTNCTNCGPRWSIIEHLPYDRPRTSMAEFRMCPACAAEYADPSDRRFHAQPIACPDCGPQVQLLDREGGELALGPQALWRAAETVVAGRVLAMKGLGGFQLIVDAANPQAVARLRQRKRRYEKPLAVMLATLDEVRRHCHVSGEEARVLASAQAPILLLRRRKVAGTRRVPSVEGGGGSGRHTACACYLTGDIAEAVAPGNPYLGVMLPYTPLHHLLVAAVRRPIVCTSGNLSEEPMAVATEDALKRLAPLADVFLTHDRQIVRPVDDSVARIGPDGLQLLRRARGYAPLPIELGRSGPTVLAVGGHLKNTVALAIGSQVVLSAHVGDLDSPQGVDVHQRAIRDLLDFFDLRPELLACDLHPDYASTRHAEALAAAWGLPLVRVQHHHAHVAACMAEHRLDGPVLGFAWDGTGYGGDGTVWGGEVLVCQGAEFRRLAHLRTFPLPGGDRASREPRRSALGLLHEILGPPAIEHASAWFTAAEAETLLAMLGRGVRSPRTSSMGRLFDAVAAICGLPAVVHFEGHAAMSLEYAAEEDRSDAYPLPVGDGDPAIIDWEPLLLAVLADRAAGVSVGRISARFHNALAELAVVLARRAGLSDVALSGGCFQNARLAEDIRRRLLEGGFRVHAHRQVPPGDGGIALGQVLVARRREAVGG
jgi:hydrogenase maturation protein HypF